MPTFDPLHQLIKSLESTEKRHFKIFAKRHVLKDENQYVRLFDLIDAMDTYDEDSIKSKLGSSLFAKNLSSGKNYLYNLLLSSLRNYHSGRSVRIQLQELWLDIHILLEKDLLQQAGKLIRKAKKLAAQHQYDIALLEVTLLERKLIRRYTSNNANELIQACQQASAESLQRLQEQLKMLDLSETVFLSYRNQSKAQYSQLELLEQAENLIANKKPNELSFEVQRNYHQLWFNHANLTKDYQKADQHLRALTDIYEKNLFLIDEDQERYINFLNNYSNNLFLLNQLEELPTILERMRDTDAKSFKIKSLIFNNGYYLEMLYHLIQTDYQKVIEMVPAIEEGLKLYKLTKSRQFTFFYNIAIAYFLEKDYDNALEWINRILNASKLEERQDIQLQARVLQLVIHFELEHTDFAESLILSAIRYLIKNDKRHSAEFVIIKHLKEALYANKAERKAIFQQLAADLQAEKSLEEIKIWVAEKLGDRRMG